MSHNNVRGAWDIFIKDEQKYIILYFKNETEGEVAVCAKWNHDEGIPSVYKNVRGIKHVDLEIRVGLIENVVFNWC